jgi:hypothetical protein
MRPMVLLALASSVAANPAGAHGWYKSLRHKDGTACCDEGDCRPVDLCVCGGGRECLLVDGSCVPIPWERVLPLPAPDGRAHACWPKDPDVAGSTRPILICVVLPGSA